MSALFTYSKTTLAFCFVLFSLIASAQKITISGQVVDKETREPLVFATVGIKGKPIGTISNLQGQFDFHFPNEYRNDMFTISMLGYVTMEVPVWSILENPTPVIGLTRSVQMLDEVIVSDSLTAGEILNAALSRIETNYPMTPFMVDAFYRDIKKIGNTFISLLEAAVKIYDDDYSMPRNRFKLRERVMLMEVRRSLGYETKFTRYFDEGNLLEDLLLHNTVRYRQFPDEPFFFSTLRREKNTEFNGREVFVVSHRGDYDLKVYVDKNSFSIIHLVYENHEHTPIRKVRGMQSRFVSMKKTIDFKEFEGKMYLNYIALESKVNWYDVRTDELKLETQLFQQLLVNDIKPGTAERIGATERMRSYGLQYQDLPYNKNFWDNYNVIKATPLDEKIIADLEREMPLSEQFEENN